MGILASRMEKRYIYGYTPTSIYQLHSVFADRHSAVFCKLQFSWTHMNMPVCAHKSMLACISLGESLFTAKTTLSRKALLGGHSFYVRHPFYIDLYGDNAQL